jgi:uncharacterized protein YggE
MRTIRVTGTGKIRIRPDLTRITISMGGVFKEYAEAMKRSSEDTERIRDLLTGFGFDRTDLKTIGFNVEAEHESYQDHGAYKQRLIGYRYRHEAKVEFDSDNSLLGKILYALANCPVDPELRISYTVKDPEAARNELIGKAVADAKEKAAVLSNEAGVKLGEIQTIDYSLQQPGFEVRPMNRMMMTKSSAEGSYDLNIEPDDIESSDTVTVVWEIF